MGPTLPAAKEAPVEDQERYLGLLGYQIKADWAKYRPRMYRALEQSGQRNQALLDAQDQTRTRSTTC